MRAATEVVKLHLPIEMRREPIIAVQSKTLQCILLTTTYFYFGAIIVRSRAGSLRSSMYICEMNTISTKTRFVGSGWGVPQRVCWIRNVGAAVFPFDK